MLSYYNIGNKSKTYEKMHVNDIVNKTNFVYILTLIYSINILN